MYHCSFCNFSYSKEIIVCMRIIIRGNYEVSTIRAKLSSKVFIKFFTSISSNFIYLKSLPCIYYLLGLYEYEFRIDSSRG